MIVVFGDGVGAPVAVGGVIVAAGGHNGGNGDN